MISRISISELEIIFNILKTYDNEFSPPLSTRVNIEEYVKKVFVHGEIYKFHEVDLIKGVMFIYLNDFIDYKSYLSLILVESKFRKSNQMIGEKLMRFWISTAKNKNFESLNLEVSADRIGLINWYKSYGFKINETYDREGTKSCSMKMEL